MSEERELRIGSGQPATQYLGTALNILMNTGSLRMSAVGAAISTLARLDQMIRHAVMSANRTVLELDEITMDGRKKDEQDKWVATGKKVNLPVLNIEYEFSLPKKK
jgi:hypothetical protein